MESQINVAAPHAGPSFRRTAIFLALIIALIAAAIVRSSITTSLDSFTFDEAYHVGAGPLTFRPATFGSIPSSPR